MLLINRYERLIRRKLRLQGAESRHRVVAGRQLHYYELAGHGPGPALVLLHGFGANATSFSSILFGLRQGWRRIYALDLPGHGFSIHDPGQALLDVRGHAEVVWAFVEEIVREPVALIGSSLGGALSLGLAVEKGEQVRGVGLLSPAGAPLRAENLADLRQLFDPRSRRDAAAFLNRLTHRPMVPAILVADNLREILTGPCQRHILSTTSVEDRLDEQALRALPMPMLLIWGASERLLPPHCLDYFRQHLPESTRVEIFSRCGHLPYVEQPARTLKLLNELGAQAAAYTPVKAAAVLSA